MNLYSLIKRSNITFYVCMLIMVILPVHVQYLPPFIIAWGLLWSYEHVVSSNVIHTYRRGCKVLLILFILYYFWQLIGLLYSADTKLGLSNLFGRLSLILFPIVLIYSGEKIVNNVRFLLRIFALSTFLFLIFCYGYAMVRAISIQDGLWVFNPNPPEYPWLSYFYSSELVITQHPTYIAMYALLAAFFSFENWFDFSIKTGERVIWLIIGIILIISEYFLSSRAGIFITLILVPNYFIFRLKSLKKRRFVIVGILVTVILTLPIIAKNRKVELLYNALIKTSDNIENRDSERLVIWSSAVSIAKSNLFIGVGIGDVRSELTNHYKKIGQERMAQERLNAHNQYLEILLENGLIGLIIFVTIFACMFYIAFTYRNLLYGIFLLMMVMFLMFETVLYRLAGVSFFSLFSFLLIYYEENKQTAANI